MTRADRARAARASRRDAADRAARDVAIEQVWSLVPDTGCKGLCHQACGPIAMSEAERDRITRRHGVLIEDAATDPRSGMCPALNGAGRCTVRDSRPTLCRLWGSVEGLPCPHGCVPEGGRLSDVDGAAVLAAARAVDSVRAPGKGDR